MTSVRRRATRRFAVVAIVLALAASMTSGCTLSTGNSSQQIGKATTTIIATASPEPTATTVLLEPTSPPSRPGYRLAFDDEFIGPKLDPKRWSNGLPWGNTNQDEEQFYTPEALNQSGGLLTITASEQPTQGKPYSSGAINTSGIYAFTYGYTEIRAQVPAGAGLWTAFWLLSTVPGTNQETDVMEILGSDPSKGYAVLHFGTEANKGKWVGTYRDPDFSTGFHTFAIDWTPQYLVWYVDGVERYRVTQNVPSEPMYLITNLTVGGPASWSGAPDLYTVFPAQYKIDYVRVFQRN